MVCRIYKAFYSFAIFALLAQIAQIVVDSRSRRNQTKLGRYDNIEGSRDLKMDNLDKLKQQQHQAGGHSAQPSHASSDDVPYGIQDYRDQHTRPNGTQDYRDQPTRPVYQAYQGESASYYGGGNPQVRMDDFNSYGHQQSGGAYGSGGYGYSGRP